MAEVSAVQFRKTYVPIEVTDPGTETDVRPDDWKAEFPILVTPEGIAAAVSAVQFWKA